MHAPAAFRQQLLGAIPRLRRYARSLVMEVHLADDLVQTALERALAHWHQFDQRRDLVLWALSILHNAHLDFRRRDARTTTMDPADLAAALPDLQWDAGTSGSGERQLTGTLRPQAAIAVQQAALRGPVPTDGMALGGI